ncbi:MAG TPA: WD40 repeat domain-containing protein, partial [Allocoleopsis sp.]
WVQVAHEALLSEWDLLRSWITEDRDDIRLQRLLETDCHVWQTRFGESEEALLSGARLAKIAEWIERTQPRLLPEEEQFVKLSLAKRDRDRQQQVKLLEDKVIAEIKRRQTTLRAGTLVITLILVLAGTIIHSIQKISRKNQEVAIEYLIASAEASRQVNDQFTALQQGKKALDLLVQLDGPNAPTSQKLLDTLSEIREFKRFSYGGVPTEIAVSPNQQYLLVGGVEGDVKVWQVSSDSESQPIVFKNHQNQNKEATTVDALDVSRDNQLVASGDTDGKIWVWALQQNKSDHSAPQQLSREGEGLVALKFLDQSNLIAIRRNGVVENWKMNSNKKFIKLNQKKFSVPILKQKNYGSG